MTVVARGETTRQAMPGDHVSVSGVSPLHEETPVI